MIYIIPFIQGNEFSNHFFLFSLSCTPSSAFALQPHLLEALHREGLRRGVVLPAALPAALQAAHHEDRRAAPLVARPEEAEARLRAARLPLPPGPAHLLVRLQECPLEPIPEVRQDHKVHPAAQAEELRLVALPAEPRVDQLLVGFLRVVAPLLQQLLRHVHHRHQQVLLCKQLLLLVHLHHPNSVD